MPLSALFDMANTGKDVSSHDLVFPTDVALVGNTHIPDVLLDAPVCLSKVRVRVRVRVRVSVRVSVSVRISMRVRFESGPESG